LIDSKEISEIATQNRNFSALASLGVGASDNKADTKNNPAKTTSSSNANAARSDSAFAEPNHEQDLQSQQLKHPLPSRLPVLSMVAHGRRIIAIDTGNHVFLSADAGKRWKSIREPWAGRAVVVELASTEVALSKRATHSYQKEERIARPVVSPAPSSAPIQAQVANPVPTGEQGSSLAGVVTDQTGAVVAGATVRVSNPDTGESRSVQSNSTGLYIVNGLVPGSYNIRVVARGFQTYLQNSIAIPGSAQIRVDVKLTLGSETQTISVVADALAVQTDSNVVSTLLSEPDQPPTLFEITTDSLEHWTSADGINWKRK